MPQELSLKTYPLNTVTSPGSYLDNLIKQEYNVRASSSSEKKYFIGRFVTGLSSFSKKKNDNKWSLQKEGLQGHQITYTLWEKFKNKPWLLEDETGQFKYQGVLEGAQTATYYLLMLQGGKSLLRSLLGHGERVCCDPAGSWYNFNKVAQYKQLTLEEAEEKIKNRRKTADGYERWMMKAANNGPAAFGEVERSDDKEGGGGGGGGGRGRKKNNADDDEANVSDGKIDLDLIKEGVMMMRKVLEVVILILMTMILRKVIVFFFSTVVIYAVFGMMKLGKE